MSFSIEHIDPKKGTLACGLDTRENLIIADLSYNNRKNNRFVPYRVKDYPAPINFGDIGEFLIGGEWTICEFGGEVWWAESNKIGCSQTSARKNFEASRVFFDGERWSKEIKISMSDSQTENWSENEKRRELVGRKMTETNSKKSPCPKCGLLMNAGNLAKHMKGRNCQRVKHKQEQNP